MVEKLTKKGDHGKTESQRGTLNSLLYLLSCCYDRIPDERSLKKEGVCFGSQFEAAGRQGRKIMAAGT